MILEIVSAIAGVIALAVGIYKWFARRHSIQRKLADEAKAKFENAQANNDPSDLVWSFGRINKLRKKH